jgi:enoyl-CoA hydratase
MEREDETVATDYPGLLVERQGQVATVRIRPISELSREEAARADVHWELGRVFSDLRGDNSVRVIVLTGGKDGLFLTPPLTKVYASDEGRKWRNEPARHWKVFTGIVRCHEAMAAIEKPIVARINGDAIGFGSSLMLACDLIVARRDARIADMHMGMAEVEPYGPPYGIVPGDGGLSLVPLYLTPAKAKEYLMLAKEYSGEELATMGVINYAVAPQELDRVVDDIVCRLLKRSAFALAWTKRVANRHVVEQLNWTLDAGAAYELVNFHQIEKMEWVDRKNLD